jgi:transcriptional regulator with XRE-family HTH domain
LNQPQHERQRIEFGDELRTLRKSKKDTGVGLAAKTGISQSKLSKIETGALIPSAQDLLQILTVLDVPQADMQRIIQTAQALRTEYVSWRFEHRKGFGAKQIEVAELERQTHTIRSFRLEAIPGLLQTHEYARRVMSLANFTRQTDLDWAVSLRMRRQEVLYDRNRQFDFLIAEMGVLSRFCAASFVIRQLDRLKMLAALPNVTIGFIPNRVHLPQAPINSFVLYDSSLATLESITGEVSTSDEQDIATYHRIFNDFAAVALFGEAAERFLTECSQYLLDIESSSSTGELNQELSLASTSEPLRR